MTTVNPRLASVAKDIISDMFRWGIILEGSVYFNLDLRTISDQDAIETICQMDAEGLISSDTNYSSSSRYYVSAEMISEFVAENWQLNRTS